MQPEESIHEFHYREYLAAARREMMHPEVKQKGGRTFKCKPFLALVIFFLIMVPPMIWAAWVLSEMFTEIVPEIQIAVFIFLAIVGIILVVRISKFYIKFIIAWHVLPRNSFKVVTETNGAVPADIQGQKSEVNVEVEPSVAPETVNGVNPGAITTAPGKSSEADVLHEPPVVLDSANADKSGVTTTATGTCENHQAEETVCDIEQQSPRPEADSDMSAFWTEYFDPATGDPYYHNSATNETTWERPACLQIDDQCPTSPQIEDDIAEGGAALEDPEATEIVSPENGQPEALPYATFSI